MWNASSLRIPRVQGNKISATQSEQEPQPKWLLIPSQVTTANGPGMVASVTQGFCHWLWPATELWPTWFGNKSARGLRCLRRVTLQNLSMTTTQALVVLLTFGAGLSTLIAWRYAASQLWEQEPWFLPRFQLRRNGFRSWPCSILSQRKSLLRVEMIWKSPRELIKVIPLSQSTQNQENQECTKGLKEWRDSS